MRKKTEKTAQLGLLTALALIASYVEKVETLAPDMALDMSVMNPVVLVGIFVGACLAFIFAAITMGSVGKAAHSVVLEVRRQFKEMPGIIEGKVDAESARQSANGKTTASKRRPRAGRRHARSKYSSRQSPSRWSSSAYSRPT